MSIVLYAMAALCAFGGVFGVTQVGKARAPYTASSAAFGVVLAAVYVVILVLAALKLH